MSWQYPEARRDEDVVEDYHGEKVADPYRWLENPDAEETAAFVEAQNKITMPHLKECPARDKFHSRMTELFDYPKLGCPFKRGDKYFYYYNSGLQNHSVLFVKDSFDQKEGTIFLDPNTLSEDGTTAMRGTSFSEDGKLMAYFINESGSDWVKIKVRSVETGKDLEDILDWVKFSCMTWTHDHKGFFYNRYAKPVEAEAGDLDAGTETSTNVNQKLYYHTLGTSQDEDVLCYEMPEHPQWMAHIEITEDGEYFLLSISEGCDPVNRLYYTKARPVTGMIDFTKLIDNFDAQYDYVGNVGSVFTFKSNLNAPKYRLLRVDFAEDEPKWTEFVAEADSVLQWCALVNKDMLIMTYLEDVKSVMKVLKFSDASLLTNVPLELGHIQGYSGRLQDTRIFYKLVSFTSPGAIFSIDMTSENFEPALYHDTPLKGFERSDYETKQVFYESKDGTKIPMFIVAKKGVKLDKSNPCLLYGYGGFNISITPTFSVSRLIFCKHLGGVLAVANLRGGGEYGETWHKAGCFEKKQNVFDDFQCAGEYLIKEGYTQPKKLAIVGGSNGGLLVGACVNQRPDLFGCGIAHVGVMDMLRFHKFTIGHAWKTDYGCSENEKDFKFLIKYSPVHNVRKGDTAYPPLLLLTGDHDDRVVPLHSLKFIAELQHTLGKDEKQTNPLLIRVETKAGHGAGKPTTKVIDETADVYGFMAKWIGAEWTD